jgi:hypothetical protein
MRFLDLDLDFFLNKNAYSLGNGGVRLDDGYLPWSEGRVRRFLEQRCRLSRAFPLPGRVIDHHDGVIEFWRLLMDTGRLSVPFEVTHVDAHPDLSVRGGLYLASGVIRVDHKGSPLNRESTHQGNYLSLAILSGWLASLVWVPLIDTAEHRGGPGRIFHPEGPQEHPGVPFSVLPWRRLWAGGFDYMALSLSPDFTPAASDALVPVVREYMRQI